MQVTLPPELVRQVEDLVGQGVYPSAEAAVVEAVETMLLRRSAPDDEQVEVLLREAEELGGYAEMTARDWEDIEREGSAIVNSRKRR